jgi:hypothetical protein
MLSQMELHYLLDISAWEMSWNNHDVLYCLLWADLGRRLILGAAGRASDESFGTI